MPYPTRKIIDKTMDGIVRAQRDYKRMSGGYWLSEAPEYFATTHVANEISTLKKKELFVTLEENVRQTVKDAGGSVRRRDLRRLQARADVVVWEGDVAKGVVEIKLMPTGFSSIRKDTGRVCSILQDENDLEFGLIAYYRSFANGAWKPARQRLSDRITRIRGEARKFVEGKRGLHLQAFPAKTDEDIRTIGDSAWSVEVLKISR
ncbi:MAG: hypothetical protein OXC14_12825 [Rhodospirillaceae bacterium]|nr:hypothetical protein [Rhodospirillaceae bacterium]